MADLSSKLNKFNKQHERMQQTLTDVAAKRSASSSKKKASVPQSPAAPPSTTAITQNIASLTFANDKDKLQAIANVRRSPTMAQVKRVITLLLERREALLPEEINNLCFVDLDNNAEVREAVRSNVKINFDGQRYSYKATHDIKDKQNLLVFLRRFPEGTGISELKDAYRNVLNDVQELKTSGDVRGIVNTETQEEILYPDDPKVKIKLDEDIRALVRGIPLPSDFVTIEKELQKAGVKPMTNTALRRERLTTPSMMQANKQKKKKKTSKRTKYTNTHLPELFKELPPEMH